MLDAIGEERRQLSAGRIIPQLDVAGSGSDNSETDGFGSVGLIGALAAP